MKLRQSKIIMEIVGIILVMAVTFLISVRYDIMDKIFRLIHRYEQYELDEIILVGLSLLIGLFVFSLRRLGETHSLQKEQLRINRELELAMSEIRTLRGIIPICSYCKKIRNEEGLWQQMEMYVQSHSEATFSHGICEECMKKHFL